MYDYPPRVMFDMTPPSENAEPCTLQLGLTGMDKTIDFQVPLRGTKHTVVSAKPNGIYYCIILYYFAQTNNLYIYMYIIIIIMCILLQG